MCMGVMMAIQEGTEWRLENSRLWPPMQWTPKYKTTYEDKERNTITNNFTYLVLPKVSLQKSNIFLTTNS